MATSQPLVATDLDPTHWLTPHVTFAMNGVAPNYNSATKTTITVGSGGTGYSTRTIPGGTSLYTPNNGWANLDVGQDWQGANTIILLCRVNNVDESWGGIFTKNTSESETQLSVGRFALEDYLYAGVESSLAQKIIPSSVSDLTTLNTLAFTHSGISSTPMSYFKNGAYMGVSGNLGTQPPGTGVLRLGGERSSSSSFDSDVDWLAVIRVNKVLTSTEIATISSNVWAMWLEDSGSPPSSSYGSLNVSGAWKTLSGLYANVGGAWKSGQLYSKISGVWKPLS